MNKKVKWHYALDITGSTDKTSYVSRKSLWSMRDLLTKEGLYTVLFENTAQKLADVFKVDFAKQRIDSVHIQSNMRHLGRICLETLFNAILDKLVRSLLTTIIIPINFGIIRNYFGPFY